MSFLLPFLALSGLKKNRRTNTFFGNLFKHGLNVSNWSGQNGVFMQSLASSVDSMKNRITGEGPTGVDIWNRQNVVEDRDLQNQREDSAFQRQVADMQAAGVNPALMYGGAGSAGASSTMGAGSDANPADFSSFLSLLSLPTQLKNLEADTALKRADAAERSERTAWMGRLNESLIESRRAANNLNAAREREIYKTLDEKLPAEIALLREQAKTQTEYQLVAQAESALKSANARQIEELLPLQKALSEADINLKGEQAIQAKSQAALNFVMAAYNNHLIDNGYLDAMAAHMRAEARNTEEQAAINEFLKMVKTGSFPDADDMPGHGIVNKVGNSLLSGISRLSSALGGMFSAGAKL